MVTFAQRARRDTLLSMDPADREAITRSIANLWTFNALFISRLLDALQAHGGLSPAAIETLLQQLDGASDDLLEGPDDQMYAAGLLATVRQILAIRRGE